MINVLAVAVQKTACGPFDLTHAFAQLIGADPFIDDVTSDWSDHDKYYQPPDVVTHDGGPATKPIGRPDVPEEFAELYWRKGGKRP